MLIQNNILYLASRSKTRQNLLKKSHIPFIALDQNICEPDLNHELSIEDNLKNIVLSKINQVKLSFFNPNIVDQGYKFVLAADTLGQDFNNKISGKPKDYDDAVLMLKSLKNKINVCATAFVLDKRIYNLNTNSWMVVNRITRVVKSEYIFNISDNYIDYYIKNSMALQASGSITIEDIGMQFLKCINGSYSSILGLPLFELREELEKLNFF